MTLKEELRDALLKCDTYKLRCVPYMGDSLDLAPDLDEEDLSTSAGGDRYFLADDILNILKQVGLL